MVPLALLVLALPASALAVGVASGVADALAQRQSVQLPPLRRWVSLALGAPRRSQLVANLVVVVIVARWGAEPIAAVVALVVAGAAALASLVDVRCHRLPDVIVAPLGIGLLLTALTWSASSGQGSWLASALAAGTAAGAVLGTGWLVGMGLGDVKFGAALGLLSGWAVGSPAAAVLAALGGVGLASLGAAGWWAWGTVVRGDAPRWFPFGPFLAASALVVGLLTGPPSGATAPPEQTAGAPVQQQSGVASAEPVRPEGAGHR